MIAVDVHGPGADMRCDEIEGRAQDGAGEAVLELLIHVHHVEEQVVSAWRHDRSESRSRSQSFMSPRDVRAFKTRLAIEKRLVAMGREGAAVVVLHLAEYKNYDWCRKILHEIG